MSEPVHVGQARTLATSCAREAGLSPQVVEHVSIAASELASNLVKYATDGLLIAAVWSGRLDLISTDRGPGLQQVEQSLHDGFSTIGTLGVGLGGVRRMADVFDIFTRTDKGTTVLARWSADQPVRSGVQPAAAVAPAAGESISGDSWSVAQHHDVTTVALSDGLGHGPDAAVASAAVAAHVLTNPAASPGDLIAAMDADPVIRRGATVAVVQLCPARSTLLFCGVGNTTVRLFSGSGKCETLISVPGIVGRRQRRRKPAIVAERSWSEDSWLIMHTDGISERWDTADWPEAFDRDPAILAGWLLGQYRRHRDDACALVVAGGDPA